VKKDADINACKVAHAHAEEVGLYLLRKYKLDKLDVITPEMEKDIETVFL
jgi:hypothetical protein